MAIPAILAQEVWSVAQGMIAQRVGAFNLGLERYRVLTTPEIARALYREYADRPGVSRQSLYGLAVRARNSFLLAERMQNDTALQLARSAIPIDPALRPGDERYRYRVLVEFTGTDGNPDSAVVEIRTDQAQTMDSIRANINELIDWDRYPRASRQQVIASSLLNADAQVTVISVGRRA